MSNSGTVFKNNVSIRYYKLIICIIILNVFVLLFSTSDVLVERWYSQGLYRVYSWIPKLIFDWIPFSIGDLFYASVVLYLAFLLVRLFKRLFRKDWKRLWIVFLHLCTVVLVLYSFFYLSWGLNYFRQPLSEHFALSTDSISKEEYYTKLDEMIEKVNHYSKLIDRQKLEREGVRGELIQLVKSDTTFDRMLSKNHVRGKYPLSSKLASYFTVSGYFNPFTHEVHVNANMPKMSYPFTTVHELGHQMGIGFEDECNFIAFQTLRDHPNPYYAYSAYYEAVFAFLRPVYQWDRVLYTTYRDKLDPAVIEDIKAENEFWSNYSGWINTVSGVFYDSYLQHNNQPEGTMRYGMMTKLIIAWDKKTAAGP